MMLKTISVSGSSLNSIKYVNTGRFDSVSSSVKFSRKNPAFSRKREKIGSGFGVVSASASGERLTQAGISFEPFEEVKRDAFVVPISSRDSLPCQNYLDECEGAINSQINVEYSASYVYHSMYAYFDRDNVAMKGLAKFFKESSEEERERVEKLMEYQNMRGGRVKLHSMLQTLSEFEHVEKGSAL